MTDVVKQADLLNEVKNLHGVLTEESEFKPYPADRFWVQAKLLTDICETYIAQAEENKRLKEGLILIATSKTGLASNLKSIANSYLQEETA